MSYHVTYYTYYFSYYFPYYFSSSSDYHDYFFYHVTHLDSCHLRCRTYIRRRTCMTYDVVRATYDIVLYFVRTMSYVRYTGYRGMTLYVPHRTLRTMSHVNIRNRMSHIRHRVLSSPHIVYNVVSRKWTYDVICT